jgi:hypothetical protein
VVFFLSSLLNALRLLIAAGNATAKYEYVTVVCVEKNGVTPVAAGAA